MCGRLAGGSAGPNARGSEKKELAEGADYVPGHGLGPSAPAPAAMTSLPCPLPGRDASKAIFPDIAPVPSVVATYPLGLSPATAVASDLPYSGPYGHLLSYSYTAQATPGDTYLPCQLPVVPSEQEPKAGKSGRRGSSHSGVLIPCVPKLRPRLVGRN